MRSKNRNMLVALVAVFAFGALASASASAALPEFAPVSESKPVKFTGTGGSMQIQEPNKGTYECRSTSITGTITGPKTVSGVVVKFIGGNSCGSFCRGKGSQEWETKELKGRIAYLNASAKTVGLLLEPANAPFAECKHLASPAKVQGSVIAAISPGNNFLREFVLKYDQNGEGIQGWQHFEGEELLHSLALEYYGGTNPFALVGQNTLTTAEKLELRR